MSEVPPRAITGAPAVSPSLVPSDVPDAGLPFGPPPSALVEVEATAQGIRRDLRAQVRALAENANQVRYRSPLTAAVCWHEAGRLLDRRAGRPAEAWICHSRAVALFPDHKPALISLRRLARRANAEEPLARLLEAEIDRTEDPLERAALASEQAVLLMGQGRTADALAVLREAVQRSPNALVPALLLLGVAVAEKDGDELARALLRLAERWPEPSTKAALEMILALVEERLGRLDLALKRLDGLAKDARLGDGGDWARLRLALRLEHMDEASRFAAEASEKAQDEARSGAFARLASAVLALTDLPANERPRPEKMRERASSDIDLLDALRSRDRPRSAEAAARLRQRAGSAGFRQALAVTEALDRRARTDCFADLLGGAEGGPVAARAAASFLSCGPTVESAARAGGKPVSLADEMEAAQAESSFEGLMAAVVKLRERTAEETDRFTLAIAEAAIGIERLGGRADALGAPRTEADRLTREPLPALIRRFDPTPRSLADLVVAEAEEDDDESLNAERYAFAASMLEDEDRDLADRLYHRALEVEPTSAFAIAGLRRLGVPRDVLAKVCQEAARATKDPRDRARHFLRAGAEHLAFGDRVQATRLFTESLFNLPGDEALRSTAVRLARCHPDAAHHDLLGAIAEGDAAPAELLARGALGLLQNPLLGSHWFERVRAAQPDDPIALLGQREALLRAGRASIVSGELIERLRDEARPEDAAAVYLRLADLDRRFGGDEAAAALSLLSLEERLPGHRPTLVRLATYFLTHERVLELPDLFASLARSLDDPALAAALAAFAYHADVDDPDLLRTVLKHDPKDILALLRREAATPDPGERRKLLEALTGALHDNPIHISRLADAQAEAGETDQAVELYQRALVRDPDSVYDLFGLARELKLKGDHAALVDTLIRIADLSAVDEHKIQALLEAAALCREALGNDGRAAELCLDVLALSPENEQAYTTGRSIVEGMGDRRRLADVIDSRLKGVQEAAERRELHLELARLLFEVGDLVERERAKAHLARALAIAPDDLATRRLLAAAHREDGEWAKAIEHLMEAARIVRDPPEGMEVFFALGELYMDHSDRSDLAEKSFIKVLTWDRTHFKSMEHLAELYLRMGNFGRAAQALEHLVRLAADDGTKASKTVALSRVLDKHLGRSKDAERLLLEAGRLQPFAVEPVEALAELYTRQGDALALNIHLDRALATQSTDLAARPDDGILYANVRRILVMKNENTVAALAGEALAAVGASLPDQPTSFTEIQWDVGGRMGDPLHDEYLCPKAIPPGLRETLKSVEEHVGRLLGATVKQLDIGREARLDRKSPLVALLKEMAPSFGVEEPSAFAVAGNGLRIAVGNPAAVLFPKTVAGSADPRVHGFAVAAALQLLRMGLGLATVPNAPRLRSLLGGMLHLAIPTFVPEGMDMAELASASASLKEGVPQKVLERIAPFAFDCTDALHQANLVDRMLDVGYRAGFLGAGSLLGALLGLRELQGAPPDGPLADVPGAGWLMSFIFSRDHLELRRRLGI